MLTSLKKSWFPFFPTFPILPTPKKIQKPKIFSLDGKNIFFSFMAEVFSWDNCSFDTMLINRIKISFVIYFVFQNSLLSSPSRSFFHASRASEKQEDQTPPNSKYKAPQISSHSSNIAVSINGAHHTWKRVVSTLGIINLIRGKAL